MTARPSKSRRFVFLVVLVALATGLVACSSSSKPKATANASAIMWPAPPDAMARARAAGLVPETAERLQYHVHSHLDVFVDGEPVTVPAGLGIDITDPAVRTFVVDGQNQYGGIDPPCARPCISPLHTHDVSGILHTESATRKNNTLGQLFIEWNVRLDANCVNTYCKPAQSIAIYVDGTKFDGNPTTIALSDHKEIAIVIGTPPATVPTTGNFG
ncbi:MAG: hypothetical protein QOG65_1827 [Actinomycetota bacterium]|jgi:hypothetical protein|nr:hypothetical protein [Actinomycetota bacterium]